MAQLDIRLKHMIFGMVCIRNIVVHIDMFRYKIGHNIEN